MYPATIYSSLVGALRFFNEALLDLLGEVRHFKPKPAGLLAYFAASRGSGSTSVAATRGVQHTDGVSRNIFPTSGCQLRYL